MTLSAEGWDNTVYRLGDDFAVRLPRRAVAIPLLLNEQRWLPGLAAVLPVTIPAPVAVGVSSDAFPWPWSIIRWVEGAGSRRGDPEARDTVADSFADALLALHRPAPPGAPHNPVRGVPLVARAATWAGYRERSRLDDAASRGDRGGPRRRTRRRDLPGAAGLGARRPAPGEHVVIRPRHPDGAARLRRPQCGRSGHRSRRRLVRLRARRAARFIERLDADGDYDADVWRRAKAWAAGMTLAIAAPLRRRPRMRAIANHTLATSPRRGLSARGAGVSRPGRGQWRLWID